MQDGDSAELGHRARIIEHLSYRASDHPSPLNEDFEDRGPVHHQARSNRQGQREKDLEGAETASRTAWGRLVFVFNPPTTPPHKTRENSRYLGGTWGQARNPPGPGVKDTPGRGFSGLLDSWKTVTGPRANDQAGRTGLAFGRLALLV